MCDSRGVAVTLRFDFVCVRSFSDLPGTDTRARHCDDCHLDVHNFDVLSEWEKSLLMKEAAAGGRKLCVSASVVPPGVAAGFCPGSIADMAPVAGNLCLDDVEDEIGLDPGDPTPPAR